MWFFLNLWCEDSLTAVIFESHIHGELQMWRPWWSPFCFSEMFWRSFRCTIVHLTSLELPAAHILLHKLFCCPTPQLRHWSLLRWLSTFVWSTCRLTGNFLSWRCVTFALKDIVIFCDHEAFTWIVSLWFRFIWAKSINVTSFLCRISEVFRLIDITRLFHCFISKFQVSTFTKRILLNFLYYNGFL